MRYYKAISKREKGGGGTRTKTVLELQDGGFLAARIEVIPTQLHPTVKCGEHYRINQENT